LSSQWSTRSYPLFLEIGEQESETATMLIDTDIPSSGEAFVYMITAEDGSGSEGSLGLATCTERNNLNACP